MRKYKIRSFIMLLLAVPIFMASVRTTEASEVTPVSQGGTDVMAGVAVDYMGKLAFRVTDRKTGDPLKDASVELWLTSLNRYVLFGLTDENGYYEVEVVYADAEENYREQFSADGSEFIGEMLRINSNKNIKWRVYKDAWLEYPTDGVIEELNTKWRVSPITGKNTWIHEVDVTLYQEEDESESETESETKKAKGKREPEANPPKTPGNGLPKTGVEAQLHYWGLGLLLLLAASMLLILVLLLQRDRPDEAVHAE